jgi:adenylylsulfate kinase-like enzyme
MKNTDGVLITGVYGSGKSSLAAEISYLLDQRERLHVLLDLDYLGWGGGDHATGHRIMLRNLAAVAANFRDEGIGLFIVAYFVRDLAALTDIRQALGLDLRVVRLSVPLQEIERRLASDVMSGMRDDLREAAASLASGEGIGVEDVAVDNDRELPLVAREVMSWLGWH